MSDVPRVTISPNEGAGQAMIRGVMTTLIAESQAAGFQHILDSLQVTRHEVIVACWFETRYGGQEYMGRWALWATYVEAELARGEINLDDLPMPPRQMRDHDPGE